MYSVSQDYLDALDLPVRTYKLAGTIGGVSFDESNVLSIEISNQVSEGSEIKLGSVYIGELTASFYGVTGIARGSWVGKTIVLSEGLMLADNSFEYVPLGVFTIAEANHTQEGVDVVAYDAMTAFDKVITGFTMTTARPYYLLWLACDECNVTKGFTQADIEALPNGTEFLSLYGENDIETFRDLVSWVAQTLGCVATIDRSGHLAIRQYSMTPAATIDETHRFTGCQFSDFTCKYTGMAVVDIESQTTVYKNVSPDDGLTYSLGSNPFVQGHFERVQTIIDSFSDVALVPFSAQMLGGAIYDLCDCLTFSGGIADGATCGVMGYTWKYNGAYSVSGYGSNPALANAKSKTDKSIAGLVSTADADLVRRYHYTNVNGLTIADGETKQITYLHFFASGTTWLAFQAEVKHTAETTETTSGDVYTDRDLVLTADIYINGELQDYHPVDTEDDGVRLLHLSNMYELQAGGTEFEVRLTCSGGFVTIPAEAINAYLFGVKLEDPEIESIVVQEMPDTVTFFVGNTFDWTGIQVDAVYNSGVHTDVTAEATIEPQAGEEATEDMIGTLPVEVSWEDGDNLFTTSFDAEVRSLYQVYRQNDGHYLWSSSGSSIDDGIYYKEINDQVYAFSEKVTWASTSSFGIALKHITVDFDEDMRPTTPFYWDVSSITEAFSFTGYYVSQYAQIVIDRFWADGKWYVLPTEKICPSAGTLNPVGCYDVLTDSASYVPITISADGLPALTNSTITSLGVHSDGYKDVLQQGSYVIFPRVDYSYTYGSGTASGWGQAYMELNDSGITLRIFPNQQLARKRGGDWFWRYDEQNRLLYSWNSSTKVFTVWDWTFDTTNLLQYVEKHSMTFADAPTGFGEGGFRFLHYGGEKDYYRVTAIYSIGSTLQWMYSAADNEDFEQTEEISHVGRWFAPQGAYICMELGSEYLTNVWLYYSKDLFNWKKALAIVPVAESGTQISSIPDFAYGEYLLTHVYSGGGIDIYNRAATVVFEEDIT